MQWINRLFSLLAHDSVYESRGIASLDSLSQHGWTPVPSSPAAPELAGPLPLPRMAGRRGAGNLMAALLRLQDAHRDEQEEPEDNEPWRWHGRVKNVWK